VLAFLDLGRPCAGPRIARAGRPGGASEKMSEGCWFPAWLRRAWRHRIGRAMRATAGGPFVRHGAARALARPGNAPPGAGARFR
jgi:hypothetical protein